MSADNKALIRRYFEAIDSGNWAALDELFSPTYIRHDPNTPEGRLVGARDDFAGCDSSAYGVRNGGGQMRKHYIVTLKREEREQLLGLLKKGKASAAARC